MITLGAAKDRDATGRTEGSGKRGIPWPGVALMVAGIAMIPWLLVLAVRLPATAHADHWSIAWVGLDAVEGAGLFITGLLLAREDERRRLAAAVSGTLLLVDAWFDVMTSATGGDRMVAILMAVFLEIPLAVLCAGLTRQVRA